MDPLSLLNDLARWVWQLFASLGDELYQSLVEKNRYLYIVTGLKNTLLITVFAVLIGLFIIWDVKCFCSLLAGQRTDG